MYNTDLDIFNNPSEETEQFIDAVSLLFECFGKAITALPLYKIYPNKLYRDIKRGLTVIKPIMLTMDPMMMIESINRWNLAWNAKPLTSKLPKSCTHVINGLFSIHPPLRKDT